MKYLRVLIKKGNKINNKDLHRFFDYFENWVGALRNNGQIIESFGVYKHAKLSRKTELAIFLVPSLNAISFINSNEHVNRWRSQITQEFGIIFEFIKDSNYFDSSIRFSKSLTKSKALLLKWDTPTPLNDLYTEEVIPLYLLPKISVDNSNYQDIFYWKRNYEAIYGLWIRGNVLEAECEKQLSNINSSLNVQGLSLALKISKLIKKKVYYYLFSNRERSEIALCPKCKKKLSKAVGTFDYDYVCNRCRIVI